MPAVLTVQEDDEAAERDRAWAAEYAAEQAVLDELGLERTYPNVKRVRAIMAERGAA